MKILQGYRNDMLSNGGEEGARQKIEKWLNPDGGLSWIVSLEICSILR
jgi:maintenance of morphology protein 1